MSHPGAMDRHGPDHGHLFAGGDPFFRLQRAVGLAPAQGLGIRRRALFFALFCWLPIVIPAFLAGRVIDGATADPLLRHFAIHSRCLLAIPLFIVGESGLAGLETLIRHFVAAGLVGDASLPKFHAALDSADRLLNARWVSALLLLLVAANALLATGQFERLHDASWAIDQGGLIFAGWWYLLVLKPIFGFFLVFWTWRILILGMLLWRIARLDLDLIPVHPDGTGGLGFLSIAPRAFVPFVLGASIVLASHFAHNILYHGAHVDALRLPMGLYVAIALSLCLGPLLMFAGPLKRLRYRSLLDYGALAGRHGRLVDRRWIRGEQIGDDALLNAPELGPVADVHALYETVSGIRVTPIGRQTVINLLLAAALPMVPVLAIEIPVKELLKMLARQLF
jgi:hypothetical protein